MKCFPLKLVPEKTNFDFIKFSKISYLFSVMLSIISVFWIIIFNFNLGVDFTGGIILELKFRENLNLGKIVEIRNVLSEINLNKVTIQSVQNKDSLLIKIGIDNKHSLEKIIKDIKEALGQKFKESFYYSKIDLVGPQVSKQLIKSSILALILSLFGVMLYIWVRFNLSYSFGILLSLLHDVLLSLGFMSFTQLDFSVNIIAAILIIIGYSVNNSVIIYDRIRENNRKYLKELKKSSSSLVNLSINETLSRTILTVFTTLLSVLALIIFGSGVVYDFSILILFGISVGTYSSIFISGPITCIFIPKRKSCF